MDVDEPARTTIALAAFGGALARELADPMSIVEGRLELLLELGASDPEVVRRHLTVALEHARRVTATVRNLRLVGQVPTSSTTSAPLSRAVTEALDLVGSHRDRVLVDLGFGELRVGCEEALLARVIAFLLRHALEASGRAPVHLRARPAPHAVLLRIGPSGRPRAEPVLDAREWLLDHTLLAGLGAPLVVRTLGIGLLFEVELPLAPAVARRRAATRRELL